MTVQPIGDWLGPVRQRTTAETCLIGIPLAIAAVVSAGRLTGYTGASVMVLIAIAILRWAVRMRTRRFDTRWLVAAIDKRRTDMEDSSDLLFASPHGLGPLQRLQRERLERRIARADPIDLRAPWATRLIMATWAAAAVALAAVMFLPDRADDTALAPGREGLAVVPGVPRLVGQRLLVVPPAYTGLPSRRLDTLDARVPQGSRLTWTLRFAPVPPSASVDILGQPSLALQASGEDWHGARPIDRSLLYRIAASGAEAQSGPLHRIDVVADQPPRIRMLTPAQNLTASTAGQRRWPISFEVTDDYGVAPVARLRLVVAQGEGENVSFRERTIALRGTGEGKRRIFTAAIDLASVGFTEAGDLVAQLTVQDNRAPSPQQVRGPSVILRRTAAVGAATTGLDAMVKRVMPGYFRSQRQIIIDAEALIAERKRLDADRFLARSDSIGADQRILRLRYGQFMGEETGGGATAAMPTNDEEDGKTPAPTDSHDDHDDHPPASSPPAFGAIGDVTAEYGHTHDESEAATLLDPQTRATLRLALDNMWQSETALRQGDPRRALPFAYKALRFIKQVQQATRIFLARVGPELPPIDPTRRLGGDRAGIGRPALERLVVPTGDAVPSQTWQALATTGPVDLAPLTRWLRANETRVPDALSLTAAIDGVRRQPGCEACRHKLRAQLWGALARPLPTPSRRLAGDATGRRYLDALR